MKSTADNKTILLLIAGGVVLCVLIFSLVFSYLLKVPDADSGVQAQGVDFPLGETFVDTSLAVEPGVEIRDIPQDEVVVYVRPEPEVVYEEVADTPSPYSVDDLSHLDLGFTKPAPVAVVPTVPVVTPTPAVVVPVAEPLFPALKNNNWSLCGELKVPVGLGAAFFEKTAGTKQSIICLGEAVANDCESSMIQVSNDGADAGRVFVAERNDGVCAVGYAPYGNTFDFCSISDVMNLSVSSDKTFSKWQSVFADEPGETFAAMYFESVATLSSLEAAAAIDCEMYRI